tara:strand:- start:397 stop:738 length:342 start_codon:yes stop_codon:yes gene_type:complete
MQKINNGLIDKTLQSKRKVSIKKLTLDEINELKDMTEIIFHPDGTNRVTNMAKTRTAWIRRGLGGGDFVNEDGSQMVINGVVPDEAILQMTDVEQDELAGLIQKAQILSFKKK